jgi:DNA-binding transcriptional MerR regulator
MSRIDDDTLANLEHQHASGLTSGELIDVCGAHGIQLSEATLRKYVQLGLLPRSVRVGRKGKHKGSLGLYPARAIRQLVRIKQMMAKSYTIEEIRRDFLFVRADLEQLEQTLGCIFQALAKVLKQRRQDTSTGLVSREVSQAKKQSRELVSQLSSIESRLVSSRAVSPAAMSSGAMSPGAMSPGAMSSGAMVTPLVPEFARASAS